MEAYPGEVGIDGGGIDGGVKDQIVLVIRSVMLAALESKAQVS